MLEQYTKTLVFGTCPNCPDCRCQNPSSKSIWLLTVFSRSLDNGHSCNAQNRSKWARSRPAAVQHPVSCSGPPPTGFQSPSVDRTQPEADVARNDDLDKSGHMRLRRRGTRHDHHKNSVLWLSLLAKAKADNCDATGQRGSFGMARIGITKSDAFSFKCFS